MIYSALKSNSLTAKCLFMFSIGIATSLPFALIVKISGIWFYDHLHISRSMIGVIGLMQVPYLFKYAFVPFAYKLKIPYVQNSRYDYRDLFVLIQVGIIASIFFIGHINNFLLALIVFIILNIFVLLQDAILYNYHIYFLKDTERTKGISGLMIGFRIGYFISGPILYQFAHSFGWDISFHFIALLLLANTMLMLPMIKYTDYKIENTQNIKSFKNALLEPLSRIRNNNFIYVLLFIFFYKALSSINNRMLEPFLIDNGFTIQDIALGYKLIGSIVGVLLCAIMPFLTQRIDVKKILLFLFVMHCFSFAILCQIVFYNHSYLLFYCSIIYENIIVSAMMAAFFVLINKISYQNNRDIILYCFLWSVFQLSSIFFGSIAGVLADGFGWIGFFNILIGSSIFVFIILFIFARKIKI